MKYYKVLYNKPYGGFCLPDEICDQFKEKYGKELDSYTCDRRDERIIELVEQAEWFEQSQFGIAKIPVGCQYELHEYDGKEWVTWRLPESIIIDDLRMLLLGETLPDNINPITKQFLEYGKPFAKFEAHYRLKFKHLDHA